MKPHRYKLYIFDLDGTLIDSGTCAVESTQQTFVTYGLIAPPTETIVHFMGIPIEKSFSQMIPISAINRVPINDMLQTFRAIYADKMHAVKTFVGIAEVLEHLVSLGIYVGVATSKKLSVAVANCKSAGILHHIDAVIGSDCVSNYKPHPESIHALLGRWADISVAETIVIGDSCYDIEMGKQAGVDTCAVLWGAHLEADLRALSPTYVASTVSELASFATIA